MSSTAVPSSRRPPETRIAPEQPLIILQTCPWYDDHAAQGREIVRVWNETVPDPIKPCCQLQVEIRIRDHQERYAAYRRLFDEIERGGVPVCFQFSDPHPIYAFDPDYVEKLVQEYRVSKPWGHGNRAWSITTPSTCRGTPWDRKRAMPWT
jgi:hypothetical protein